MFDKETFIPIISQLYGKNFYQGTLMIFVHQLSSSYRAPNNMEHLRHLQHIVYPTIILRMFVLEKF